MGQDTNIGQQTAVTVFGNPESSKKLIKNHGQLCKIKQTIVCPCSGGNHGSADFNCDMCNGDGYIYTYQRRFLVVDENSRACDKTITPFWTPIISVDKIQNVTSAIQGGVKDYTVDSFTDTEVTLTESISQYEKKRVTYTFDGWTYIADETLRVDTVNKLMYADGTVFDAGYQSSNPLKASSDIAKVVKIWNHDTEAELTTYVIEGNTISTTETIGENMHIEYYQADLTQVITSDIAGRNNNETYTHDLTSGECKMAFYPFWELSRGDLIIISATVLYKSELVTHLKDLDKLFEIEIFDLNEIILDESGNKYELDIDYVLQGRHIKWISSSKPADNALFSIRYGYKPAYIIFEDNPQPNNLENKQYPKTVLAKSWSKISKDDVARLINE